MRGLKKWKLFPIILGIVALFMFILMFTMMENKVVGQFDFYQLNMFLANEKKLNASGEGGEEKYLDFGVLYYPGEIVEGSTIMNECAMAIYNPGPDDVDLSAAYFTWSLGSYMGGAGYYNVGTLLAEKATIVSCSDVFGSTGTPIIINVPSDKFILNNIPLVVILHSSYGEFKWEGSADYIPQRALV